MAKNQMLYQKTLTYRLGHGQKSNAISKNINSVAKSLPKIHVCVNAYYILVLAEQ